MTSTREITESMSPARVISLIAVAAYVLVTGAVAIPYFQSLPGLAPAGATVLYAAVTGPLFLYLLVEGGVAT